MAYFLDPSETHGQGAALLKQFLVAINCSQVLPSTSVRVSREVLTNPGRRIDIVLQIGDYRIGIENKPWATESDSQCLDYAIELERLAPGRWMLVFLTPDGRKPCSAGRFDARVTSLAYDKLFDLRARSPQVQLFLDDLFQYLRVYVLGEPAMLTAADQQIIECLLHSDNIGVTLQVLTYAATIRQRINPGFSDALLSRLQADMGPDWQLECRGDWDKPYAGIYYYRSDWKGSFGIGFSNQKDKGRDVRLGVWCWDKACRAPVTAETVRGTMNQRFGKQGSGTDYWLWQIPLDVVGKSDYMDWHSGETQNRMSIQGRTASIEDLYPLLRTAVEAASSFLNAATDGRNK